MISDYTLLNACAALRIATIVVVLTALLRAAGRYGTARIVIERGGSTTLTVCALCMCASTAVSIYARTQ